MADSIAYAQVKLMNPTVSENDSKKYIQNEVEWAIKFTKNVIEVHLEGK